MAVIYQTPYRAFCIFPDTKSEHLSDIEQRHSMNKY